MSQPHPQRPELTVVVPVYNSQAIFRELHRRLTRVLEAEVRSYEIIAVVDGCPDDSAEVVAEICMVDPHTRLLELSRNFGEQAATTAGLLYSSGEMVVVMDDDLEDPPEVIPAFIAKAREGYDVVYGIMKKRKTSVHRRFFYSMFYRFLNLITEIRMPHDAGSFSLMKRHVVEQVNRMPESNRYVRGLRSWVGFNQVGIEYEREERYEGDSGYDLGKYFRFAMDAILSFSYKPLEWLSAGGLLVSAGSILYGIWLIYRKLSGQIPNVPGWASMMVVQLFLGGVILLALGVIGQYVARIYDETKRRPPFVIQRSIGFPVAPQAGAGPRTVNGVGDVPEQAHVDR